jgi:ferredoxin-type protein NapF
MTEMSTARLNRRQLLRGRFRSEPEPIRPPWSSAASIARHCERCGDCAKACPQGIVRIGEDGFPFINFALGECTFCGACAEACPAPVFADRETPAWQLRPAIGDGCLAAHGVYCRSCGDACPERAISFRAALGGRAEIAVDAQACTGCGACVSVCPRNVVAMETAQAAQEAVHG